MDAKPCHRCGQGASGPEVDWSSDVIDGEVRRLCPSCTRTHIREIESKLDDAWWVDDPPTDQASAGLA